MMISEEERRALWERHTAPLRCPPMLSEEVSGADEQVWRGITSRVERLLEFGAVLPAGLTAMLADYRRELGNGADGRWEGTGLHSRALGLAEQLGRAIAEGRWKPGERVHDEDYDHLLAEPPAVLRRALQVLAAWGEVVIRTDGYYVRGRDDGAG